MIISVTCYKIWGHINVLVAVYADILWSRRGSYACLKCVSSQFMEELLEELWTLRFPCSSYMTLTSLLTLSVSPLSEGRRAFQHYRVRTAYVLYWSSSLSLKDGLTFSIGSINYFHRSSPSLSCYAAHSSGDGIFWKAGPVGLLIPKLDRTAAA